MATYQVISFDQSFPSTETLSSWMGSKYTILAILIFLLLLIGVIAYMKAQKEKQAPSSAPSLKSMRPANQP